MTRRFRLAVPFVALVLGVVAAAPATAAAKDVHSKNMKHVGSAGNPGTTNSDLAFWGNLLFEGSYAGPRIIDISDPTDPRVLASVKCNGGQGDVSVWKNLLFVSVDADQNKPTCDSAGQPGAPGFEGIRIFNVRNPSRPKYVTAVQTDCGSHTHTLLPDPKHGLAYLYIESYPLTGQDDGCNFHNYNSVVKVPLANPKKSTVSTFDGGATQGCHDVTVNLRLKLAAAACLDEGQIWDISDPAHPKITQEIHNPQIQIWHSATFSNDGKTLIFGDEAFGGDGPGCAFSPMGWGRLWFYDTSDLSQPVGSFSLPRGQDKDTCTAHNFNVVPGVSHDILVGCFYQGGTSVIDFTDPTNPKEIGYYQIGGDVPANEWSTYWYNGYIYSNDINRGIDVFSFRSPLVKGAAKLPHLNPQTQE